MSIQASIFFHLNNFLFKLGFDKTILGSIALIAPRPGELLTYAQRDPRLQHP